MDEMPERIWAYEWTGRNDGAWHRRQVLGEAIEYIRADAVAEMVAEKDREHETALSKVEKDEYERGYTNGYDDGYDDHKHGL